MSFPTPPVPPSLDQWIAQGKPDKLTYNGIQWLVIRDNDRIRFIAQSPATNFDTRYASTTQEK